MMLNVNCVLFSGRVTGIKHAMTNDQKDASTFLVYAEVPNMDSSPWVRVNAYGSTSSYVRTFLKEDDVVLITGEIMNRVNTRSQIRLMEVRLIRLQINKDVDDGQNSEKTSKCV